MKVIITLEDKPGALYEALNFIQPEGFKSIQSFPVKGKVGIFKFFLEADKITIAKNDTEFEIVNEFPEVIEPEKKNGWYAIYEEDPNSHVWYISPIEYFDKYGRVPDSIDEAFSVDEIYAAGDKGIDLMPKLPNSFCEEMEMCYISYPKLTKEAEVRELEKFGFTINENPVWYYDRTELSETKKNGWYAILNEEDYEGEVDLSWNIVPIKYFDAQGVIPCNFNDRFSPEEVEAAKAEGRNLGPLLPDNFHQGEDACYRFSEGEGNKEEQAAILERFGFTINENPEWRTAPKRISSEEKMARLMKIKGIIESGFSGCLPNGNIVDRREYPEAVAIQANSLFNTPPPKEI